MRAVECIESHADREVDVMRLTCTMRARLELESESMTTRRLPIRSRSCRKKVWIKIDVKQISLSSTQAFNQGL